jgi:hypothetical protein
MWPDDYYSWLERFPYWARFDAVRRQLVRAPILRAAEAEVARICFASCERAQDLADTHREYQGYFIGEPYFRHWLVAVAHQEALRQVLGVPQVRAIFPQLSAEDQQLLYWYYVDALSIPRLTTVHYGQAPGLQNPMQARFNEAYRNWCLLLGQRGYGAGPLFTFPL